MEYLKSVALRLRPSPPMDPEQSPLESSMTLMMPAFSLLSRASPASTDHLSPASSSSSLSSASSFWMARPRRRSPSGAGRFGIPWRNLITKRRAAVLTCIVLAVVVWMSPPPPTWRHRLGSLDEEHHGIEAAARTARLRSASDPARWLQENSNNKYAVVGSGLPFSRAFGYSRPRAALISLVRNAELPGMMQSMRQLEFRWNRNYQYPWVFFNDEPFTAEFKAATRNLTSAKCYYEVIPKEHWSLPDWVDEGRFMNSLEYLGAIGVGKGWMVSYRHMCRWNSGFFYKHPRLKEFDWYWRVEPDVHYFCDIDYDVFRFMRDNKLKYGFNMNILDDARSFPSLWSRTRAFMSAHPELIHPEADLNWLLDPRNGGDYNNCQFFSNFEIGDLRFFRSEAYERYFDWLDRGGGFYYERFGDAPIHTLSLAMFVPKRQIWFFNDIGYQHDINRHCPAQYSDRCACEATSIDENFYKLVPFESPQRKPEDTCIRQFLGGDLLKKKDGWSQETERAFGGDGYHGYELTELGDL